MKPTHTLLAALLLAPLPALHAATARAATELLVEAESFKERGGWVVDPQFMDVMGSPYLLAHGLGKPVSSAKTEVEFPATGRYHVWVRTKDWVPSHHPGMFKVLVAGRELAPTFGANGRDWSWQNGGEVEINEKKVAVELRDLTGFDGRCDAIYFTTDKNATPPETADKQMASWRRKLLGLPEEPVTAGKFDVVVVGGGIAGCSAALTASRLGLKTALVHDRPVLGGNASSECGIHPYSVKHPIVREVIAQCGVIPWGAKEPPPGKAPSPMAGEANLSQVLGWRAFGVEMDGTRIVALKARDIRTNEERRFVAPVFIDCTGDGWVGFWAGADFRVGREGYREFGEDLAPNDPDKRTHGNTITFKLRRLQRTVDFPDVPWATAVSRDYANLSNKPDHFWEAGQGRDTLAEAEWTRDHLLRAIFGTMATAKRRDPAANANLEFESVGYILARGESRRLMGDHLLTQNDRGRQFHDAIGSGTSFYCLHYTHPDYDFRNIGDSISKARGADQRPAWETAGRIPMERPKPPADTLPSELRKAVADAGSGGTQIPYRCLYSRNVDNLLMAGRDVSATHVALMGIKVMGVTGHMGVAAGAAASLCTKHGTTPRGVYQQHLAELQDIVFERGAHAGALRAPGEPSGMNTTKQNPVESKGAKR